jgi:hypothetical protein
VRLVGRPSRYQGQAAIDKARRARIRVIAPGHPRAVGATWATAKRKYSSIPAPHVIAARIDPRRTHAAAATVQRMSLGFNN